MAVVAAVTPAIALAQVTTDVGRAPTLSIDRYSEDWSYLGDPDRRSGHWTEPFKYIRISGAGTTYLTIGIEGRLRYEHYENVNWGASPDDSYLWQRLMPYAGFHADKARLFVQPIVSVIAGAEHAKTSVDTTGIDMLQAFGDIEMAVTPHTALRLSAGRKLVSLGAGRLIDNRYGPNVPLAFDGGEATLINRE